MKYSSDFVEFCCGQLEFTRIGVMPLFSLLKLSQIIQEKKRKEKYSAADMFQIYNKNCQERYIIFSRDIFISKCVIIKNLRNLFFFSSRKY